MSFFTNIGQAAKVDDDVFSTFYDEWSGLVENLDFTSWLRYACCHVVGSL